MSRQVKVSIAGQVVAVRTDAKPKYVRDLADYVTAKVEEARASGKIATTQSLALYAAMIIADELFQAHDQHKRLTRAVRERGQRILHLLEAEAGGR